mgnify:CR=1 FL=1
MNQMIGSRTHPCIPLEKHSSWKRPKNPFRVSFRPFLTIFDHLPTLKFRNRLVGHFAYCATPLSLMSFKLSKTFNYQPLFFHSPTQNENVKKVQSVFLPNWNWLFLLIFSLFKVEKIKIHDWSTAEVSSWISQLCSSN